MHSQHKRYRQCTLFESFALNKKQKVNGIDTMIAGSNVVETSATSVESRATCSSTSNALELESNEDLFPRKHQDRSSEKHSCKTSNGAVLQNSDTERNLTSSPDLFPDETPEHISDKEYDEATTESSSLSSHSAELFPKSTHSQVQESHESDDTAWEKIQLSFLNRSPACDLPLPKLEPLENHSIMFSPHIRVGVAPRPYPNIYHDKWDSDHVRMPCSPLNRMPIPDLNGEKHLQSRWDLICDSLSKSISSSYDLEAAIMRYNGQYKGRWNFKGLHAFFDKCLLEEEREHFFETILPGMIRIALDLPIVCTQSVPLLKRDKDHYLTLSQKQIGCLLANAFFCTFPRRTLPHRSKKERWTCEYAHYPDINFNRLYAGTNINVIPKPAEKLKCLLNYFKRITTKEPSGTVTFHRQCIEDLPKWNESTCGIRTAIIKSDGLIETEGHGMLQIDFANKYVGGGVLGHGCVQEEIRFIICPELIVSRLFVESLVRNEALTITGVEQYNKYSGYSDTFKWEGDFQDQTPRDAWGRRCCELVAIDALHFRSTIDQYKSFCIERELNKAYCGFFKDNLPANLAAVATGNWGCGAFKGNPNLKFLIQLMSASQAGRSMVYFTFGSESLKKELKKMYDFISDKNLSVGDLWRILHNYSEIVKLIKDQVHPTIPNYICSVFTNKKAISSHQVFEDSAELVINDSDKLAIEKLIEAVKDDDDSATETEELD